MCSFIVLMSAGYYELYFCFKNTKLLGFLVLLYVVYQCFVYVLGLCVALGLGFYSTFAALLVFKRLKGEHIYYLHT